MLANFARRRGITFPLLSDDGSATIEAFGIRNTVADEALEPLGGEPALEADVERYVSAFEAASRHLGTPFPGTFIVDRAGRVTARYFEDFYRERNTTASIMLRLGTDLNPIAGVEGSTAHLAIRAYQSNAEITFGSRFSLLLEITPQPGMHVYAPGSDALGYRVIGLTLADNPHVRFEPVEYPPAAIYHFEPLDERVPVYQEPFTLVQQVVVRATREAEETLRGVDLLTLTGRLDYRACDDAFCYDPTSVPLSWTVTVAPHDWQRANRPQ